MILEISAPNKSTLRKPTWKEQLRKDIYHKNRTAVMAQTKTPLDRHDLQARR
jgi:hypothetical protein